MADKKLKGPCKIWRVMDRFNTNRPVDFSHRQDAEKYIEGRTPTQYVIVPIHETEKLRKILKRFLHFKCEGIPGGFTRRYGYSKGDEDTPFFSEAFLYVLLGKEDARTGR